MIRPVFAFPPLPEGWQGEASRLIRIVDPAGDAIAWLDPSLGMVAGYAVRSPAGGATFRHILAGTTAQSGDAPEGACPFSSEAPWRFMERDPASCTLRRAGGTGNEEEAAWLTASLDDGVLSLTYRLPESTLPAPLRITLVCTATPAVRPLPPWRESIDDLVISHDPAFIAAPIHAASSPDGIPRFIATLELLPCPGRSQEYLILVEARAT